MPHTWLDQMFEPCGVYRPVREHGRIVDFERIYLNAAGRVMLLTLKGDESITSMLEEAPNLVEQGLFARYVEVADTGIPWSGTSQTYADDKRALVMDVQAWRVPEGIAITYRDVTEREALTLALTESERRFRITMNQLPEGVSVFEAVRDAGTIVDFRWSFATAEAARESGFSVEELVGSQVLELFPAHRDTGMVAAYADVVETGDSQRHDIVWHEDEDELGIPRRRAIQIRAAKVGDGLVVVSRDVTPLQRLSDGLSALVATGLRGLSHEELMERLERLQDLARQALTAADPDRATDERTEAGR